MLWIVWDRTGKMDNKWGVYHLNQRGWERGGGGNRTNGRESVGRKSSETHAGICPYELSHPTARQKNRRKPLVITVTTNAWREEGGKLIHHKMMQGWAHPFVFLLLARAHTHNAVIFHSGHQEQPSPRGNLWLNLTLSPPNNITMCFPQNKVTVYAPIGLMFGTRRQTESTRGGEQQFKCELKKTPHSQRPSRWHWSCLLAL